MILLCAFFILSITSLPTNMSVNWINVEEEENLIPTTKIQKKRNHLSSVMRGVTFKEENHNDEHKDISHSHAPRKETPFNLRDDYDLLILRLPLRHHDRHHEQSPQQQRLNNKVTTSSREEEHDERSHGGYDDCPCKFLDLGSPADTATSKGKRKHTVTHDEDDLKMQYSKSKSNWQIGSSSFKSSSSSLNKLNSSSLINVHLILTIILSSLINSSLCDRSGPASSFGQRILIHSVNQNNTLTTPRPKSILSPTPRFSLLHHLLSSKNVQDSMSSSTSNNHHFFSGVLPPYVAQPLSVPRINHHRVQNNQTPNNFKQIITVVPVSSKDRNPFTAVSHAYQFSGRPEEVRYIPTPVMGSPVKPKGDDHLDDHIVQTDSLIDRNKQMQPLLPQILTQVTPTASATTILPETFYQQERNRKLLSPTTHSSNSNHNKLRIYSGSGHSNTKPGSSLLHHHPILSSSNSPSFSSFRHSLSQLGKPLDNGNAIHPTDGSIEVDLRDLITKELEERSRMDPSLIHSSYSPSSGVNLFALLRPESQGTEKSGNRKEGSDSNVGGRYTPSSSVSFSTSTSRKNIPLSSVMSSSKKNNNKKDQSEERISHSHAPPKETSPHSRNRDRNRESHLHHHNNPSTSDNDEEENGGDDETEEDSPIEGHEDHRHEGDSDNRRPSSVSTPSPTRTERLSPKITYVTHVDPPTAATPKSVLKPTKNPSVTYTRSSTPFSTQETTEKTTESSVSFTHFTESDANINRNFKPGTNGRRPVDWSIRHADDDKRPIYVNSRSPSSSTTSTVVTANPNARKKNYQQQVNRNRVTAATTTRIPMNSTETIDLSGRDHTGSQNGKSGEDPLSTSIDNRDQNHNSVLDDFLDPGTAADGSHGHHVVNQASPKNASSSNKKETKNEILDNHSTSQESEPYRLTTERLAYILIGSCCGLSILCLLVVAFSIKCRDMCDEYRAWKKSEKLQVYSNLGYTTQQHAPLGPGLPGHHLSRHVMRINGRTGVVETVQDPYSSDSSTRPLNTTRPIFGPSCCCCPPGQSKSLTHGNNNRNGQSKSSNDSCPRGYFHPTPRGKLPFGAASSVHQFLPPRSLHVANHVNNRSHHPHNNSNNNAMVHSSLSEEEEEDSILNPSMIEHPVTHSDAEGGCTCSDNNLQNQGYKSRQQSQDDHYHHQSRHNNPVHNKGRSKAVPKPSNPSWIASSILVDELHRKHQQQNISRKTSHPSSSSKINENHNHTHQHLNHRPHKSNNNNISYQPQPLTSNHNQRRRDSRSHNIISSNHNNPNQTNAANFNHNSNNSLSQRHHSMHHDDQTRILWSGNDDRLI